MEFAPAIDPRLRASVGRIVDLRSSAAVWRELRRRARRFRTTTPCYESTRKLVIAERERRARSSPRSPPCSRSRVPGSRPPGARTRSTAGGSRRAAPGWACGDLRRDGCAGRTAAKAGEKARAAFRRPSIPVASVGFGRGASYLSPASITRSPGRRRGMRVPFARLWRFPSGSRGHASTRWYLHCRYCWNLSRPDHLLSAVRPNVYRERWTTASPSSRKADQASTTTMPSSRTRTGYVSTGI